MTSEFYEIEEKLLPVSWICGVLAALKQFW